MLKASQLPIYQQVTFAKIGEKSAHSNKPVFKHRDYRVER